MKYNLVYKLWTNENNEQQNISGDIPNYIQDFSRFKNIYIYKPNIRILKKPIKLCEQ